MPIEEDIDSASMPAKPNVSGRYSILVCCVVSGMLLSFGICLACLRIVVGTFNGPGASLGLSGPNLHFVDIAAMFLAMPTMVVTVIVFAFLSPPRKLWAIVPAVLIPLLGGCMFAIFLISGLST